MHAGRTWLSIGAIMKPVLLWIGIGDEEDGRSVSNFQYFSSPAQVTVFFVGEPTKVEQYKRPVAEDF